MKADVRRSTSPDPLGRGALRPRARLRRTLGDDLISSDKVALIELVKNSYAADAAAVVIRLRSRLGRPPARSEEEAMSRLLAEFGDEIAALAKSITHTAGPSTWHRDHRLQPQPAPPRRPGGHPPGRPTTWTTTPAPSS